MTSGTLRSSFAFNEKYLSLHCFSRLLTIFLCLIFLSACAAQSAYKEGRELIAKGQIESGLVKLKQAADLDRSEVGYRTTYLLSKADAINAILAGADRDLVNGNTSAASEKYLRVTGIEADNRRALDGIKLIELRQRHDVLMKDANYAFLQKNYELASTKLQKILSENPEHGDARKMTEQLETASNQQKDTRLAESYRRPITIEFRDTNIKQIFEIISRTSGINFLFDKDVRTDQRTSIFLKNSTIESAIQVTLMTNQLEQQVLDSNTVLIFPNSASKLKDYQELVVKTFFIANAEAKTVATTLKTILKTKDIVVDEKLNLIIMRDSIDAIRLADKLIALQDIPEPEVMLEVEILEVKRSRLQELGIKWPDSLTLTPLASGAAGLTLNDLRSNLNSRTIGTSPLPVTANFRKEDTDANLLANPRIRARNHEKAKILIGERVPNVTSTSTATGFVSESINYIDVGLKLEVEPTVYLDNDVAIKVALEVSSLVGQNQTKAGSIAYQIGTRTASTVLRLKDGETQILAGLINDEDRSNGNKVPLIGELPLLGRLFGSTLDNSQKTEIVLSITPRLIRNIVRPANTRSEFLSGTENVLKHRQAVRNEDANQKAARQAGENSPLAAEAKNGQSNTQQVQPEQTVVPSPSLVQPDNVEEQKVTEPTNQGEPNSLRWHGPSSVNLGDIFVLQLSMQSKEKVFEIPLSLTYDPLSLELIEATEGNFFRQIDTNSQFKKTTNKKGRIDFLSSNKVGAPAGSFGFISAMSFRALKKTGNTQIKVLPAEAIGEQSRIISLSNGAAFSLNIQ